jgi:hypothetical protein
LSGSEEAHTPGRRPKPEISFRQLAQMWKSYRQRHDGTDEELANKFLRSHGGQIEKLLGLKIGRKIEPKQAPWGSLRNAIRRGKEASARIRSRRQSSWQFVGRAFGRHKSSLQVIRLGLARQKFATDPRLAAYLKAAEADALLGRRSTALF